MFDALKWGWLGLTRPARVLMRRYSRDIRHYSPDARMVVEIDPSLESTEMAGIEASLAFATSAFEVNIDPPKNGWDQRGLSSHLRRLLTKRPSHYLFIRRFPTREEVAALKMLDIPYRVVMKPEIGADIGDFPEENPERTKWHQALERRPVIYLHLDQARNLELILENVRRAQRNFPNLLLIISGIQKSDMPADRSGLILGEEKNGFKSFPYFDILLLESLEYQPLISSIATVQLITQGRSLRKISERSIERGAAIVFYDVRPQSLSRYNELINSGTVWAVKKRGTLSAVLSQVLNLENAANSATQSSTRLFEENSNLISAVDELLGLERA